MRGWPVKPAGFVPERRYPVFVMMHDGHHVRRYSRHLYGKLHAWLRHWLLDQDGDP